MKPGSPCISQILKTKTSYTEDKEPLHIANTTHTKKQQQGSKYATIKKKITSVSCRNYFIWLQFKNKITKFQIFFLIKKLKKKNTSPTKLHESKSLEIHYKSNQQQNYNFQRAKHCRPITESTNRNSKLQHIIITEPKNL